MIAAGDIPPPDLIKMDIQGAELLALEGATQRALPYASVLALELWMLRGYGPQTPLLHEIMEFLQLHDYFPFEFGDDYRERGLLVAQDVWFCRLGSSLAEQLWNGRLSRRHLDGDQRSRCPHCGKCIQSADSRTRRAS
jgi:hypothetical protein